MPQENGADLVSRAEGCLDRGEPASAIALLEKALALGGDDAQRWHLLGVAYLEAQQLEAAERCCRMALQIDAKHARAWSNLGTILQRKGAYDLARRAYREALDVDPRLGQAHYNLGTLLLAEGRAGEAIDELSRAAALDPRRADWWAALGYAFERGGRPLDAITALERALAADPALAAAHEALANCRVNMGEARAALAGFRRAIELEPTRQTAHSNMLFAMNYVPELTPESVFREHGAWARRVRTGMPARGHANDPSPGRRLKIGYLSPDFKNNAVAYFIKPVLERHDRSRVEVVCYSDVEAEDELSDQLRALADVWQRTAWLANDQLEERIRADAIDILVDLAGHTNGGERMPLFARKPAPVQATWLGYLNTTGLDAMDYRISDALACPPGMEAYHSERIVRLPDSQWCYDPLATWPEVGPLPAGRDRPVTFGSFNNLAKVVPAVLELWARVLSSVPGSRMVMVGSGLDQIRSRFAERMAAAGADPSRLEFFDRMPLDRYFAMHNRVDINLDTFPFTGGTTTFHSLWMGVPVVTLAGAHVASRGGVSILSALGLQELIADSEDHYVQIAASLAADRPRLEKLRGEMRQRLRPSALMDAERFTKALESAYREMWRTWCAARPRRR